MERVEMIKEFYSSMSNDSLKLEMKDYGFELLRLFKMSDTVLDYGELHARISKYRLSNVRPEVFDYLLYQHVEQHGNVCLYFGKQANNAFAFNLDNSKREGNTEIIQELKTTADIIVDLLNFTGIEPLVYLSGRGYHIWVRVDEPIDNELIADFMEEIRIWTKIIQKERDVDSTKVHISRYPNDNEQQTHSLRLFGSKHVKNQEFSCIRTKDGRVLDELYSWRYFNKYILDGTITKDQFMLAYDRIKHYIDILREQLTEVS